MIGKVSPHGQRVTGLIYYLFGPGREAEHTDPHIVAGWRHPAEVEPPLRGDGRRDFRHLTGLLQQPHDALGPRGSPRPVWHCSVRAAPEDRILSDDEWARVACDVMHRTGLAPYGQEDEAIRWIVVRHAPDHIHLVAMLARQDGTRPQTWNDYFRVGEACRAAEQRFRLRRTDPRDRTAARRPTRPESEKARRRGLPEAPLRPRLRPDARRPQARTPDPMGRLAPRPRRHRPALTRPTARRAADSRGDPPEPGDTRRQGEDDLPKSSQAPQAAPASHPRDTGRTRINRI